MDLPVRGEERVYADASPLIGLARIRRLDLLDVLPTPVYVTEAVWREVSGRPEKPGVAELERARDAGLLRVVPGAAAEAYLPLGPGESATLSIASEQGAAVLIDDREAVRFMQRDPRLATTISAHIDTVGLVVLAKQQGMIAAGKPILLALMHERLHIGRELYERAVALMGEDCGYVLA